MTLDVISPIITSTKRKTSTSGVTKMKTYSNASNASRAAKTELAKTLGLPKSEIKRGEHFDVRNSEFKDGFIWNALGGQTPTKPKFVVKRVKMVRRTIKPAVVEEDFEAGNSKREVIYDKAGDPIIGKTEVVKRISKAVSIKVQKNREERNGVKRPSEGGKCAQLWALFDKMYGEAGIIPTPKPAKARSAEHNLDPVTTTVQLYKWREFMGFKGR